MTIDLDRLRRFAVSRSLFPPTTLERALLKLGFVQADPIRAPARAQDLTLRHRVKNYRAGDLERQYSSLDVEEDVFVNYGFVTREVHGLMHPRAERTRWPIARRTHAQALLEFVRDRGPVHPRVVDRHFSHGTVTNYWGGASSATTDLLAGMHYRGMLRVARRDEGVRIYAARDPATSPPTGGAEASESIDALIDVAVRIYAPLPGASLSALIHRLRYAVPQWQGELRSAVSRARQRLSHARVNGTDWYWPTKERVRPGPVPEIVRLLAPFDPVVWDRRRFELLWGWAYRFEAYTPARKRKRGYYALPMLWRDRVIGWGNVSMDDGGLQPDFGYIEAAPREAPFKRALDEELDRMRQFLGR